jgi:hypothetical protein
MAFGDNYDSRALDRQKQGRLPERTGCRPRHPLRHAEAFSNTASKA